ncbi:hypothetical protein GQ53DRAFT_180144 [Thozetella sp. PMI_491]|nr:hypothetical protein GQ53DRAFT_180144 [Thozetella sp. PMI_491]
MLSLSCCISTIVASRLSLGFCYSSERAYAGKCRRTDIIQQGVVPRTIASGIWCHKRLCASQNTLFHFCYSWHEVMPSHGDSDDITDSAGASRFSGTGARFGGAMQLAQRANDANDPGFVPESRGKAT